LGPPTRMGSTRGRASGTRRAPQQEPLQVRRRVHGCGTGRRGGTSSRRPSTASSPSTKPVSSRSSRSAAASADSPRSQRPPGHAHCPGCRARCRGRRVSSSAASGCHASWCGRPGSSAPWPASTTGTATAACRRPSSAQGVTRACARPCRRWSRKASSARCIGVHDRPTRLSLRRHPPSLRSSDPCPPHERPRPCRCATPSASGSLRRLPRARC
jgi:hypothetical protein